ncbi:putative oxidoreductase CipA-like protein [Annulohypoxylon maeteangense]|uniref:putative oxidoreductase CipA-like protein n=1 Tax=Annulohypoxylon maeteangense TaxID=1927788 RepID=UPI002007748C|nr:putative oxidoreductase CipA-like protein [Annulohypoxylon maeteangense]KAI0884314.1 putative oxidoreductase CipA-like protein [Annulohypoxylon maeteangense]
MSTISKVAVAGASGSFGLPVVHQLIEDGFKVTVLTRKGTNHNFPSGVTVAEVDYESPETLVKALAGQDAVVSVIGFQGLEQQIPLVEAAVKAGVKRFIPSEFGGDAENENISQLPMFVLKKATKDLLKKEAALGKITYTLITTGPFLDMALQYGLIANLKEKKIKLWDGGERSYSTTTIASATKATSEVLKHLDETKNRVVFIRSASLTQKGLLEKVKKAAGPDGWTIETPSVAENLKAAYAQLKETGEIDRVAFIVSAIWGEEYGSNFQAVDNDLLGVKELSDVELQNLIDGFAK